VGSAWTKQAQLDVVGINSMEKTIILGECKWGRHPIGSEVLDGLVEKTGEFVPKEGKWTVYYFGFARMGWTEAARRVAREAASSSVPDRNWHSAGMELLDLNQIDEDLKAWSR
jgi:hypothetical protein